MQFGVCLCLPVMAQTWSFESKKSSWFFAPGNCIYRQKVTLPYGDKMLQKLYTSILHIHLWKKVMKERSVPQIVAGPLQKWRQIVSRSLLHLHQTWVWLGQSWGRGLSLNQTFGEKGSVKRACRPKVQSGAAELCAFLGVVSLSDVFF